MINPDYGMPDPDWKAGPYEPLKERRRREWEREWEADDYMGDDDGEKRS